PLRVLFLAAVLTSLAVMRVATKPRLYTARIILRATQGDLNPQERSSLSVSSVRDRIWDEVFTRHNIIENIIKKHDIHADTLDKLGPEIAIECVMDPLEIDVVTNYYLHTLYSMVYEGSRPTLRLFLSYQSTDPEFAYKLVSLLADLVVEDVRSRRLAEARIL